MTRLKFSFIYFSVFFISLFLTSPLLAQSNISENKFSPSELKSDLNILKENMEAIHTALYLYYPKDSLDAAFVKVENQLNQPMTEIEFYRLLPPLLKYIANGHTDFYVSENHIKRLAKELPRFPFDVYWDRDTLFVLRNMSEAKEIKPGYFIKKINGQTSKELIDFFASQITRDGFNTSLPIFSASNSFKTHYALLLDTPDFFEIEFENNTGENIQKKIKGELLTTIIDKRRERYTNLPKSMWQTKEPAYTLSIDKNVATMTLKTFDKKWVKKTTGKSHKKFFKESFAQIKENGTQHLIIDLRNNGGGEPEPTIALFAHLYDQRFDFYNDMRLLVNRIPNAKLYASDAKLLNLFAWARVKKRAGGYVAKSLKKYQNNKPAKNIFKGKTYVLTNPQSYSATGEMTGILKNYNIGTFIGEEPGGNPISNTSGVMLPLLLPNTKIRAILPVVQFLMAVDFENTGKGITPDHYVKNSFQDQLDGKDRVMEYTLNLINKN